MKRAKTKQAKSAVVEGRPEQRGRKGKGRKSGAVAAAGKDHKHDASTTVAAGVQPGKPAAGSGGPDDGRAVTVPASAPKAKEKVPGSPDQPNVRYLTGVGEALAHQNVKTVEALRAAGHKMDFGPLIGKAITKWPFGDAEVSTKHARIGASLAGVEAANPISWPDMKKVEEDAKAARPPMSDETKEKLRAYAAKNPKDKGDDVAVQLRECKSLEDVFVMASQQLGETVADLHKKYDKLNPGQRRMVLGNRMRAKWKKDNLSAEGRAQKAEAAK